MASGEELAAALSRAHERFAAAVAGVDPVTLETEPIAGSWSARDLAGHLADWETETLDAAAHILGGPKPRHQPIRRRRSYNTLAAALRGADAWDVAATDLGAARRRAEAFVAGLTPEQLRANGPYPWGQVGTLARLIDDLVGHLNEHAAQVEEWRLRRSAPRSR